MSWFKTRHVKNSKLIRHAPTFRAMPCTPMSFSSSFKHFIWYHFEDIQHLIVLFVFEFYFVTLLFFLSFFDFLSLPQWSVPQTAVFVKHSAAFGCEPVPLRATDMAAAGALAWIESLAVATAAITVNTRYKKTIGFYHSHIFPYITDAKALGICHNVPKLCWNRPMLRL